MPGQRPVDPAAPVDLVGPVDLVDPADPAALVDLVVPVVVEHHLFPTTLSREWELAWVTLQLVR